mgnify:CR=1 FL=1
MDLDDQTLDALIAANAKLLRIEIAPEWLSTVRLNLAASYRIAGLMEGVALADDAEPAPVYEP